ncbi:Hypothetical protein AA314_01191 [Archangium gephyra]|uniref:Uncharacterized protein n=1 Tax=Archangium gephyra TaxID=48 RepID=A0AAC8TB79_9BACT|nr:Hypothetical protein AA314_01191 [Archangium gephyra]
MHARGLTPNPHPANPPVPPTPRPPGEGRGEGIGAHGLRPGATCRTPPGICIRARVRIKPLPGFFLPPCNNQKNLDSMAPCR